MKLNDTAYSIIKWATVIAIPAISCAILGLGQVFPDFTCAQTISQCLVILQTLLGSLFCISTATYYYNENTSSLEVKNEEVSGTVTEDTEA